MKTQRKEPKFYGMQAEVVLKGNYIAIQAYLTKQEKSQINNLTLYLKDHKKKNKQNPKLVEGKKS